MTVNNIEFNKARYDKLVKEYNQAVKDKKESFRFLGHELVTNYAKYVIQALDPHFKHMK